jgi:hypothetical protein
MFRIPLRTESRVAWYRVVFWQQDPDARHDDVDAFVKDYCQSFFSAGLRTPAAFERRSEDARTFYLNPLASAFYFNGPGRSERATTLLRKGMARPLLAPPDITLCRPVACGAAQA